MLSEHFGARDDGREANFSKGEIKTWRAVLKSDSFSFTNFDIIAEKWSRGACQDVSAARRYRTAAPSELLNKSKNIPKLTIISLHTTRQIF